MMQNVYWSCASVCLFFAAFPHYSTDPDITWENGRGCFAVVHYGTDLQSVHGFRCCDNIRKHEMSSSACARCLVLSFVIRHKCIYTSTLLASYNTSNNNSSVCVWPCVHYRKTFRSWDDLCPGCRVKIKQYDIAKLCEWWLLIEWCLLWADDSQLPAWLVHLLLCIAASHK